MSNLYSLTKKPFKNQNKKPEQANKNKKAKTNKPKNPEKNPTNKQSNKIQSLTYDLHSGESFIL